MVGVSLPIHGKFQYWLAVIVCVGLVSTISLTFLYQSFLAALVVFTMTRRLASSPNGGSVE
ncbi:hypothetical protein BDV32DRAFT_123622 [Aspergillus pseudonomiae]|uniref:Uncharacterized protein n=1 Tax=Aspergillus pseudonomiae TaxID=1506151 RepID=A0A5N6I077_9EURO|nr:uncharacterized protein BDV37DRAFT_239132 [Aspergillus pseudonomiae]KAB8260131.1 hypothetical protein BDV32DRAFT_123622 [Aspergillus pseudonomiae]KAE8408234.1 hypothetical protein BDV37DRAFT_239132 [Aspergillus pseudonomiae]